MCKRLGSTAFVLILGDFILVTLWLPWFLTSSYRERYIHWLFHLMAVTLLLRVRCVLFPALWDQHSGQTPGIRITTAVSQIMRKTIESFIEICRMQQSREKVNSRRVSCWVTILSLLKHLTLLACWIVCNSRETTGSCRPESTSPGHYHVGTGADVWPLCSCDHLFIRMVS